MFHLVRKGETCKFLYNPKPQDKYFEKRLLVDLNYSFLSLYSLNIYYPPFETTIRFTSHQLALRPQHLISPYEHHPHSSTPNENAHSHLTQS